MRQKGSITVFAALSIMLVAQLLFTLLEAARNIEFYRVLQMNTDSALESMFADYVFPLWDDYRILGAAAADSSGQLSFNNREAMLRDVSNSSLGSKSGSLGLTGSNLLAADTVDIVFEEYLLLTDQGGRVFQAAVTSYMKHNLVYETAKTIYSNYEAVRDMRDSYGDQGSSITDALAAIESAKESEDGAPPLSRKGTAQDGGFQEPDRDTEDNLLTSVVETQKTGILALVLPEKDSVSGARIDLDQTVSHRALCEGTASEKVSGDWYDQVLLNQYLVTYLSDYTDGADNRGLNYELEYLIGGKAEDKANLRIVTAEILAIREALNLASLAESPGKQAEALSMAMALAGATANPVIVEAVKYGILAAWAYAESVLDLRTLLQGGKIAVCKSDYDWTSNLSAVPSLLSGWSQAKSSERGLTYRDYLGLLLFFHGSDRLAMRAMDVQEAAVRLKPGYENFRMDCLVCGTKVSVTYEYAPIFFGFVTLPGVGHDSIRIRNSAEYTYLL